MELCCGREPPPLWWFCVCSNPSGPSVKLHSCTICHQLLIFQQKRKLTSRRALHFFHETTKNLHTRDDCSIMRIDPWWWRCPSPCICTPGAPMTACSESPGGAVIINKTSFMINVMIKVELGPPTASCRRVFIYIQAATAGCFMIIFK